MRHLSYLACGLLLFCAQTAQAAAQDVSMCGQFRHLPTDVRAFIERQVGCRHFAGEHTGGASRERDTEVNAEMDKLRCNTLDADALALVKRYWEKREVADAVLFFADTHHLS